MLSVLLSVSARSGLSASPRCGLAAILSVSSPSSSGRCTPSRTCSRLTATCSSQRRSTGASRAGRIPRRRTIRDNRGRMPCRACYVA
eukprot:3669596-Pleurochrysis_carterae.AAC.9